MIKNVASKQLSPHETNFLAEHAITCETCANELRREDLLNELCNRSTHDDDSYMIPMNVMRSRVEQQFKQQQIRPVLSRIMPSFNWIARASVAVTLSVVIYFGYFRLDQSSKSNQSHPFEYEVALSGISPVMVEDKELICELLYNNGLTEASYDLLGCESTCNLVIFNLNSIEEAAIVVDMFHSLHDSKITTNVTLIERADT